MTSSEFETITGPAFLASALVNGDTSGLSCTELCEDYPAFLRYAEGYEIVGIATDPDTGESMEPWFTWNYDLYGGTARGGNVIDYIAMKLED